MPKSMMSSPRAARLRLEAIHFLEDVGRQPLDAVEIGVHLKDPESPLKSGIWTPGAIDFPAVCGAFEAMVSWLWVAPAGRSPKLAAFAARNGPLDHFVRLGRTAPHPCTKISARRLPASPLGMDSIIDRLAVADRIDQNLGRGNTLMDQFLRHRVGAGLGLGEDGFQMLFHRHVRQCGWRHGQPRGRCLARHSALKAATAARTCACAALLSLTPSPGK